MDVSGAAERALRGNLDRGGEKLKSQNKLFVRDRLALLLDEGSFVEDGLLANALAGLPPARVASTASAIVAWPEIMSTGAVISFAWSSRSKSIPLASGRRTSMRNRSMRARSGNARISAAEATALTW